MGWPSAFLRRGIGHDPFAAARQIHVALRLALRVSSAVSCIWNAPPYGFCLPVGTGALFISTTRLAAAPSTSISSRKVKKCW